MSTDFAHEILFSFMFSVIMSSYQSIQILHQWINVSLLENFEYNWRLYKEAASWSGIPMMWWKMNKVLWYRKILLELFDTETLTPESSSYEGFVESDILQYFGNIKNNLTDLHAFAKMVKVTNPTGLRYQAHLILCGCCSLDFSLWLMSTASESMGFFKLTWQYLIVKVLANHMKFLQPYCYDRLLRVNE